MAANRHDHDRTVRNHLLEFANAGEMLSFEDRYITDPEFLKLVEIEEERLIEDYLLGQLETNFKKRFELVYLRNPHWVPKIDLVRQRLNVKTPAPRWQSRSWTFAFATSAVMACVALIAFLAIQRPVPTNTQAKLEAPIADPFVDIRLSPGLSKGLSQSPPTVPAGNNRLRFTFEMPGVTGPISCRVRVSLIEADGTRREIAIGPLSSSRPGPNSEAILALENQIIPSGDFLAEVIDANGGILNRYVFRATSRH